MAVEKNPKDRYQAAYEQWSERIGTAKSQLATWRFAALLSILLAFLLLIALIVFISTKRTYVYVAEVHPGESVNKVLLPQTLNATQAQQAYFIGLFINNIMSLPLDPVIARQNWFDAYNMATGEALAQLTIFAQAHDPLKNLGTETQAVDIGSIQSLSDHSIEANWTATTYNNQGVVQDQANYNGVFTFTQAATPTDARALLKNPFGLKITYFTINRED